MKKQLLSILLLSPLMAAAQDADRLTYVFDFANPESLTPSIVEPPLKEGVQVADITFTEGPVSLSFTENSASNTHVRIYHSYDAGCDLRIYDGESVHFALDGDEYSFDNIVFDMSFSGLQPDVTLMPSVGSYVWEENTWYAVFSDVRDVTLTSFEQSRTPKITVTLNTATSAEMMNADNADKSVMYYDIFGHEYKQKPTHPGIYISNGRKILVK
ncbi:MAG: hypothetical protein K2I91_06880 [Muribaculaceae bacterium]|nr:hypothetical protein [Muribaculaceae bacterium]